MRLESKFRYAQVFVVALLVAANPFGMAGASTVLQGEHCAVAAEHRRHAGDPCGQQSAYCSTTHCCCPILPELAAVAAPRLEPGPHERMPSVYRPLLLIRAIDPPPRSPTG
ncbi:hypothetical protein [Rhizobium sullae]|uniref:hypothetical protein n=1 Tax=Rhizobium sullae TaxID=50338 RepID=UPI000B35A542|nr:hypothetical protein [Rhizobium sullae]